MNIILVRHAESEANRLGILQGQKIDTSLSKRGLNQAKLVAKRLENEKISAIYASDLKRAMETAQEIAKFHNLKVRPDKRLREKNHHAGETQRQHEKRCLSFFKEVSKHKGNIIAVAHGGTNSIILAISTGNRKKGAELYNSLGEQKHTCINVIEKKGKKYYIRLINCAKHLKRKK